MAVRHEDLRMIEGGTAKEHPLVRQRFHERDQRVDSSSVRFGTPSGSMVTSSRVLIGATFPAAVELDDFVERADIAVMEIRGGQRDVAQRRHLERAIQAEPFRDRGTVKRGG